jgi:hypothetical protein
MNITLRRILSIPAIAAMALAVVSAPAAADNTGCSTPPLTQPFSAWGDDNWYAIVPGQTDGNFDGTGWTLSGGAQLVSAHIASGDMGTVLDLPSGATAVSPATCVNPSYPTGRTMIRDLLNPAAMSFSVSYQSPSGDWSTPVATDQLSGGLGWAPSSPVDLQPPNHSGWRLARFTFTAGGSGGDYQIYNFYIDPYSRG